MTRITTSEVCTLARFSRATLWRRVAAGTLPAPIDHGRQAIFDRDRVVQALAVNRRRWNPRRLVQRASDPTQKQPEKAAQGRWNPQRWKLA